MAKSKDLYETDKEKRARAEARAADVKSRTTQRQGDPYTQRFGYPNLDTMTAAETSRERAATNQRLTDNATTNSKIEALKALSITGAGSPHGQAALDELAKVTGIKVPKVMDPKTVAMNKVRAAKGLPPLPGTEEAPKTGDASSLVAPQQQNQSVFQPVYDGQNETGPAAGTTPVPAGGTGEPTYGKPVTPHLGTGGAEITPENPTGQLHNPWGAGGLFQNPTHEAAQNQRATQATMYPTGPVSPIKPTTYFPGEAMDRLAGGSQPQPLARQLPPSSGLVAPGFPAGAAPQPPAFDPNRLVQPQAGPRTSPNVNIDLDALASHIGNWFSSQANQMKKQTTY